MVIKKNIKQKGVWFLKKKPNRKNKIILNEGRDLNNLIFGTLASTGRIISFD